MRQTVLSEPMAAFTPGLQAQDPVAGYWLQQAIVHLRREICWLWHEQGLLPTGQANASLPAFREKVVSALDLQRFWEQKQVFFQTDPTAAYLTGWLSQKPPEPPANPVRGTFSWVVQTLHLSAVECFVLALGLVSAFDHAAGPVIAACLNDPGQHTATLGLAQRLWHEPEAVLAVADPGHSLSRLGLLPLPLSRAQEHWEQPLAIEPVVASILLTGPAGGDPADRNIPENNELSSLADYTAARLQADEDQGMQLVPMLGADEHSARDLAAAISRQRCRTVASVPGGFHLLSGKGHLNSLAAACWLKGSDLFLEQDQVMFLATDHAMLEPGQLPNLTIPITLYLPIPERSLLKHLPAGQLFPAVEVPKPSFADRLSLWKTFLGGRVPEKSLAECSRRFRFSPTMIKRIGRGLQARSAALDAAGLMAACRSELSLDFGELAQKVEPRFLHEELILPAKLRGQFQEILRAMRSLTDVHYGWGTERVWNEAGITVLFAGPSGTGKTMAAEILAEKLDLPMYRIDLSQVVSKYIGETEKQLKRVFDAGELSDAVLFFDEADALFGKRSEVKDAHDRYANLEISYLLERMERFKGLAILATNRKKDLDEAFLRRLRYTLDFPVPGVEERQRIWRQMIPKNADASKLDFDFLSCQFSLSGGHIRSIVFNACLQSADQGDHRLLTMEKVLTALKWECEKLNRALNREQFGPYVSVWDQAEARHA